MPGFQVRIGLQEKSKNKGLKKDLRHDQVGINNLGRVEEDEKRQQVFRFSGSFKLLKEFKKAHQRENADQVLKQDHCKVGREDSFYGCKEKRVNRRAHRESAYVQCFVQRVTIENKV